MKKTLAGLTCSLTLLLPLAANNASAHAETNSQDTQQQSTQTQQKTNDTEQTPQVINEVILPNEDRHQITNTTSGHYQSIGFINAGQNIASGVVIDDNTVLTNKHAANLSDNLTFAPAAKDSATYPYGKFTEKDVQAYPGDSDLVLVHFNKNSKGQSLGDVVQPASIQDASTASKGDAMTVTGYPGDKPMATMWESKGKIIENQGTELTYGASTFGGNSGSPVFNSNNQLIGLHHGGVDGQTNNAVAMTGDVLQFINNNKY
ncbi:serine protease [Staphylococcus sp. Marseille-Q5304]|uniref:trypsin-like serine peptidase n=1 Tax=Staphylococcus sp. Marseille-Q5304 TaxID=2942200 RepID=UPI002073FD7C|nr:serine protease [Staphylococcus sp. Marseille-Q5304]